MARTRNNFPKLKNNLRRWWDTVGVGSFEGESPILQPIGPDLYLHIPNPKAPLGFRRPNDEFIQLNLTFSTDHGTIPPFAKFSSFLSKTYYNIAYYFHDQEYVKREEGLDHLSFEQNNLLLVECIKTLQTTGYLGVNYYGGAGTAHTIFTGVSSFVGHSAWRKAGIKGGFIK